MPKYYVYVKQDNGKEKLWAVTARDEIEAQNIVALESHVKQILGIAPAPRQKR